MYLEDQHILLKTYKYHDKRLVASSRLDNINRDVIKCYAACTQEVVCLVVHTDIRHWMCSNKETSLKISKLAK